MSVQTSELRLDSLTESLILDRVLEAYAPLLPDVTLAVVGVNDELAAVCPTSQAEVISDLGMKSPQQSLPLENDGCYFGQLMAWGTGLLQSHAKDILNALQTTLVGLIDCGRLRRLLAAETLERYREINLLYKIGESINASLNLAEIPALVLQEAGQVIDADVGLVVLTDADGEIREEAGSGDEAGQSALRQVVTEDLATGVENSLQTEILTERQLPSVNGMLSTVIMAPMSLREHVLGFALLGRMSEGEIFTAGDRKLLNALVSQTAVAVENARLFANVKEQRDAIAKMNVYMENIFASLASGVITLDPENRITFLNQAAGQILGIDVQEAVGQFYGTVLPYLKNDLIPLVRAVRDAGEARVGYEAEPDLPDRGLVDLQIHISPLQGVDEQTTGVTIVVDDLTEQRKLEAEVQQMRSTFERYVSPRVVEQLLSDPSRVQLGGARQDVTILFADIRGFTAFSESVKAEVLFEILNRHLTLVAEAVLEQEGTLDKFMGDAVMAIFNAPLAQESHVLRAVRAAWQMKTSLSELHQHLSSDLQLNFGIGISTGPAVVGNVGSPMLQNYTAIGNTVNLASRLQTHAGPGQILLGGGAYAQIQDHVRVRSLGQTYFKGHSEPTRVLELLALLD